MKNISRILCCLLLFPGAAVAMDLAALQETAVQERAVVARSLIDVEKSVAEITVAKGGYYPSVDLYYRANVLDENSARESAENSVLGARISWNLFAGFRDRYRLASAEERHQMEQLQFQALRQEVRLDVALSYLNVYDKLAQLTVAEDTCKTLEKIYDDGQNRFAMGLIGKNEVLQFQVDYDNADIARKKAAAEVAKSVNKLSQMVGVTLTLEELLFAEFKEIPGALDEEGFVVRMLAERSELQALKAAIAALEKRGLEYDLKELEDRYRKVLENLFIDYRVNLANVAVVQRAIAQAEENLRITQLKYTEGLQRESELLDAIAKLSRARYNKVAVIRSVFFDYFQIIRMVDQI